MIFVNRLHSSEFTPVLFEFAEQVHMYIDSFQPRPGIYRHELLYWVRKIKITFDVGTSAIPANLDRIKDTQFNFGLQAVRYFPYLSKIEELEVLWNYLAPDNNGPVIAKLFSGFGRSGPSQGTEEANELEEDLRVIENMVRYFPALKLVSFEGTLFWRRKMFGLKVKDEERGWIAKDEFWSTARNSTATR